MIKIVGSIVLLSFLFCSCSSSSDDNTVEFELTKEILTQGYWYSNIYLDSDYSTADGLEALKFEVNGDVKQMELSGMRESVVGNWDLDGNYIIITKGDDEERLRVIEENSSDKHLKLYVGNNAFKEYYREYDFLNGLSADAFLVNEYTLDGSGYHAKTRYGYRFTGMNVVDATVLLSDSKTVALIKENGAFVQDVESIDENTDYFEFDELAKDIRFYAKVNGTKLKLKDVVYSSNIEHLNYANILVNHAIGSNVVTVSWNKLEDSEGSENEDVRYRVDIYPESNGKIDMANPVFISGNILSNIGSFEINSNIEDVDGNAPDFSLLSAGSNFYVVVSAILYEPDINADFGINKDINIQAISSFTKKESQW